MTPMLPQSKPMALSGIEITGSRINIAATDPSAAAARPTSTTGTGGGGNSFMTSAPSRQGARLLMARHAGNHATGKIVAHRERRQNQQPEQGDGDNRPSQFGTMQGVHEEQYDEPAFDDGDA